MAKQKGPMKYVGTLGDIRHFKIKGLEGYYAGMVGGPTAEQIATAPEFQRTRENMNEFGGCAKAGKSVRTAFSGLKQMTDTRFTGKLTGIMKRINLEDESEARGQRAILITAVPQHLKGVDFNSSVSLSGVFNAPYTITPTITRESITLDVPAFNPANNVTAPSGATHFRILTGVACISDFNYNADNGTYEPIEADLNELADIQYSAYTPLDTVTSAISVTATLPGSPTLTTDVSVLVALGIEFYQAVGANYYLFSQGNTAQIKDVLVA